MVEEFCLWGLPTTTTVTTVPSSEMDKAIVERKFGVVSCCVSDGVEHEYVEKRYPCGVFSLMLLWLATQLDLQFGSGQTGAIV